ncbi:hypothetical protein DMB38_12110 [Streptomyces sp. WAC 06738]|uniref:hypothetical protein n=1 Tax=Streptomyces sp. WAC 06738 TaxID=2203210 RepID=UPI000F6C1419|nr:hypothetical protein [Streptomyces sp. WAC 06738]AZM46465.1 hypothetical protein DMB38_12110 [Streptomyces sp. WAC 06738]
MSDTHERPDDPDGRGHRIPDTGELAQQIEELERKSATASRLFDVRRLIGGLFVAYGLILAITGAFDSDAEIAKAEDVRINLWTGLGMLALGLFFLVWQLLRPVRPPSGEELAEAIDGDGGQDRPDAR